MKDPTTNSERWAIEHAMMLQRSAWLEDTATMKDTHRAMRSWSISTSTPDRKGFRCDRYNPAF